MLTEMTGTPSTSAATQCPASCVATRRKSTTAGPHSDRRGRREPSRTLPGPRRPTNALSALVRRNSAPPHRRESGHKPAERWQAVINRPGDSPSSRFPDARRDDGTSSCRGCRRRRRPWRSRQAACSKGRARWTLRLLEVDRAGPPKPIRSEWMCDNSLSFRVFSGIKFPILTNSLSWIIVSVISD
jgi:hypothetical protein